MDSLHSLYLQLREGLDNYRPQEQPFVVDIINAQCAPLAEPLGWLKGQTAYPQFYLNLRDSERKIIALGEIRAFFNTDDAQDFIQRQNVPLVGGLTFGGQSYFFLPRLLLRQDQYQLHASLLIDRQKDIEQEKQAAADYLKTLKKSTALQSLDQSIRLIEQKADQSLWSAWVEQALEHIRRGGLDKVVLANQSVFESYALLNDKDFLAVSERYNSGCYHFLFAQNAQRTFLGSTPERLYRREGLRLQTEALAGTAMMNEDQRQNEEQGRWLLNDEKNIYENRLVAEGIRYNLQNYAKQIEIGELSLKPLRQVQHLQRNINVELISGYGDKDYLHAIHPTAAVSGLPQQAAQQFLQNTENFDRTWYAGILGFMQPEEAEFCVTIRSAFIEKNKITVFAGAGIVEGSIPLLEWQEIERKAAGLVSLFKKSNS